MILAPIAGQFTAPREEDEIVGAVSIVRSRSGLLHVSPPEADWLAFAGHGDSGQSSASRNAFAAGFPVKCGYPDPRRHGRLFDQPGGRQISLMAELHQMVSVSRFDSRSDIAVGLLSRRIRGIVMSFWFWSFAQ